MQFVSRPSGSCQPTTVVGRIADHGTFGSYRTLLRTIMISAPEFLVIDDNRDSRFLLTKTLLRKFPDAVLHECETSAAALEAVQRLNLTAIICHRTEDTPGIELL